MATAPDAAASTGPPTVDAQDPLPEPAMKYRRYTAWIVVVPTVILVLFAAYVFWQLDAPHSLLSLAKWNIGLAGLVLLLYMAGATSADIARIIQTGMALRNDVRSTNVVRSSGLEGTAENINSAGTDAAPVPVPPPPPMFEPAPELEVDAAPTSRST